MTLPPFCRVGRRFFNGLENGKPTARLDKTLAVMSSSDTVRILNEMKQETR